MGGPAHAVPADVVGKHLLAPMRHAVDDLVTAERAIQLGDQIEPHVLPLVAEPGEQRAVHRNAAALLLRDRPLKLGPKHRVRERRANGRNDVRQQPRERAHIVLAIVQDVALFLSAEGRALQNTFPHIVLVSDVDLILEEVSQRAADRIEALLAVAALDRAVIHVVPELDVGVERARRLAPALRGVKAELGGEHVADDQRVVVEPVRREWAELVLPQPD